MRPRYVPILPALVLVVALLWLAGGSGGAQTLEPYSKEPHATQTPTKTPASTPTPTATLTPSPTATPTPAFWGYLPVLVK